MSVRLSLLALLDQGPCYGYQLRTELDWRTGGTGPINVGQIYNTLDRLERDKLVQKTGENNYYEITDTGRREVRAWFGSPSPASDLASKLALAATLPGVDIAAIIRVQRAASAAPAVGGAVPATADQLASTLIAAASRLASRMELELLDEAARLLTLRIAPAPLSSEVPKRGRPVKVAG